MKLIGIELYKLRRKHLFPMIAIFLAVEIAWAFIVTGRLTARNSEIAGWESIIAMISGLNVKKEAYRPP